MGRSARYSPFPPFHITVFKRDQSYSIKIKHIHNESANVIDSYDVFDTNDWSNLTKATTVIGIWIMATRARSTS